MKKILTILLYILLGIIAIGFIIYFYGLYESNIRYSIAEPVIVGSYNDYGNNISIQGLQDIVNDSIATLTIEEFNCYKNTKTCTSDIVTFVPVMRDSNPLVYATHVDYKIIRWDESKIVFESLSDKTVGVVDLKLKKVTFTIESNILSEQKNYKEVVILTDPQEIKSLERKIIRKGMKRKVFGNV